MGPVTSSKMAAKVVDLLDFLKIRNDKKNRWKWDVFHAGHDII